MKAASRFWEASTHTILVLAGPLVPIQASMNVRYRYSKLAFTIGLSHRRIAMRAIFLGVHNAS
jgi:hypothetical protein